MRANNLLDWLLEGMLLLVFCGVISGLHFAGLDYGDPVVTMWAVAGVWITFGLARCIHYRIQNRGVR